MKPERIGALLSVLCLSIAILPLYPQEQPWPAVPKLLCGHELIYRGTIEESTNDQGVIYQHKYLMETRLFVYEVTPEGFRIALLTKVTRQEDQSKNAPTARLELVRLTPEGKLVPERQTSLAVSLDGPTTLEIGFALEVPAGGLRREQTWTLAEPDRPPRTCRVLGLDTVQQVSCIKIQCLQQSEDWEQPRADQSAWRRQETVWLSTRYGLAQRVERIIERRTPAREEPTWRLTTRYELDSTLRFEGPFFEDLRREVQQAAAFQEKLDELLPEVGRVGSKPFENLLARLDQHMQRTPGTPYRAALVQIRQQLEAARRGQTPVRPGDSALPRTLTVGRPAPEFVLTDLTSGKVYSIRKWRGQVVLLCFYLPGAVTADDVLPFAQTLAQAKDPPVVVVGMAMSDEATVVHKLQMRYSLSFPQLAARGLRHSYAVDATPRFVIVDAEGIVRAIHTGWGPDIPVLLTRDLRSSQKPMPSVIRAVR